MPKLPLALRPHHDGSALYVPNQKPQLHDRVTLRLRVHEALGSVREVRVRFSDSGEPFMTEPAKLASREGSWAWYETVIPMQNPRVNYRWAIFLEDDKAVWVNARGLSHLVPVDAHDFQINTYSAAPTWAADSVMYQIFPDRFARSGKTANLPTPDWAIFKSWGDQVIPSGPGVSEQFFGGDLWGVIEHLDHLKNLGVTLLYLTPFFPGGSNHRYDASSFGTVDPLLGGDEALAALIKAAHEKGFKIIGDLTSNHSGDRHEWFRAAYQNPAAPESDFYYFTNNNNDYACWWGHRSLPKFNWNSAELSRRFIEGNDSVVGKWLQAPFGFDGWRIDVSNMTGRHEADDLYLDVAKTIRRTMSEINPDSLLLGEYTADPGLNVQGDAFNGAMTYSNFTRSAWRWFFNRKVGKTPIHMVTEGQLFGDGKDFHETYTQFIAPFAWHVRQHNMNALDTHDLPRFKTFTIEGAQAVAAGMQFALPGIPVIWSGDEFGLDGINGEDSRTPLPWNNERPYDKHMFEVYASLTALRKANPALVHGSVRFVFASSEAVAFVREAREETLLVLATRGKEPKLLIEASALPGSEKAELIYGSAKLRVKKGQIKVDAGKLAFAVWRLPASK